MKLLCMLLLFMSLLTQAQTTRVLIVGDSWAKLQLDNGSHVTVFSNNGYADIFVNGTNTARDESEASEWAMPSDLGIISDALIANPDIDTVQLTIGGYDFLNNWSINMSAMDEMDLQQQVSTDISTVVNFILLQDPNIEIILSFYDYPNYVDTIEGLSGFDCNNYLTDMGLPTTTQLNTAIVEFENIYAQIAANNPRVHHVSHFGLMQSFYGFPPGTLPGEILPPGDLGLPSPVPSMLEIFPEVFDCNRLNSTGYELLVQNLFDGYYQFRFDTIFKSSFE